jgi:hypothetical protein
VPTQAAKEEPDGEARQAEEATLGGILEEEVQELHYQEDS